MKPWLVQAIGTLTRFCETRYYERGCTNVDVQVSDDTFIVKVWRGPEQFRCERVSLKEWEAGPGEPLRELCSRLDRTFFDATPRKLGPVKKRMVGRHRWVVHS